MTYSKPVVLKECFPLDDAGGMIDHGLKNAAENWQKLYDKRGDVPTWSSDFAMQNAGLVSRTIMYDTRGGEIEMALIGEQCREFIGLKKTKGFSKFFFCRFAPKIQMNAHGSLYRWRFICKETNRKCLRIQEAAFVAASSSQPQGHLTL